MAIIGGGVIGLSIGLEIARRGGRHVTVIDHGGLGGEASRAAAGVLAVAGSRAARGIVLDMGRRCLAMYPSFLGQACEDSGAGVTLQRTGATEVAFNDDEMQALVARAALRRADGFHAEVLDRADLRRDLPELDDSFVGGVTFADVAVVDPGALLDALRVAGERRGAEIVRGAQVAQVEVQGRRAVALTVGSSRMAIGSLVVAAGWWTTALLAPLGVESPIRPARGEMIALRWATRLPSRILVHRDAQIVPHGDAEVWIGTTVQLDSEACPTEAGRLVLLDGARRLVPRLNAAAVKAHWAGIRPCSAIRRPIIDFLPEFDNVIVAAGHHRNGFLLAPVTALQAAALLEGGSPPFAREALRWRLPRRGRWRRFRAGR